MVSSPRQGGSQVPTGGRLRAEFGKTTWTAGSPISRVRSRVAGFAEEVAVVEREAKE